MVVRLRRGSGQSGVVRPRTGSHLLRAPNIEVIPKVRNLIKLEELFLFLLSIFLFAQLDYAWWWYAVLFLAPDVGMLGYLAGPAVGAVTYNLVHHRATVLRWRDSRRKPCPSVGRADHPRAREL